MAESRMRREAPFQLTFLVPAAVTGLQPLGMGDTFRSQHHNTDRQKEERGGTGTLGGSQLINTRPKDSLWMASWSSNAGIPSLSCHHGDVVWLGSSHLHALLAG
uniref:Putative secreted protein n=1 Tax=Anopheles darlingi TaxID=43151 RepID=A0A2M4DGE5_ANODA